MLHSESMLRKDRNTAAKSPTMQHRHYAKVAAIIKSLPLEYRADCARRFESELRYTNPNFDSARFLRACGE